MLKASEPSEIVNPTLTLQSGNVAPIPIIEDKIENVSEIVNSLVELSMWDWGSYETSWDLNRHPLLRSVPCLANAYTARKSECEERFRQLKVNEEELNSIFIDIYGL